MIIYRVGPGKRSAYYIKSLWVDRQGSGSVFYAIVTRHLQMDTQACTTAAGATWQPTHGDSCNIVLTSE